MGASSYSLGYLAEFLGAKLVGDPQVKITGIGSLTEATAGQLSFLQNTSKYGRYLVHTQASAVMVRAAEVKVLADDKSKNWLVVDDPYLAYAKVSYLFQKEHEAMAGIHASVIIGKDCVIAPSAAIGPYVVVGNRVQIGEHVVIAAGCIIGNEVVIGTSSQLFSRVVLYDQVVIGDRVRIHSGAVVGSDGFGNANENGTWRKIYQLGKVVVGNEVEIGANTTIDRGAIGDTVVETGVKIDNLVQIGHNVQIGAHTAIAGGVGIAGSTKIGKGCMIGGQVGIAGHLSIADRVVITGMSGVAKSIKLPGVYASAIPAVPHRTWWRAVFRLMQLDRLLERVKNLERRMV